MNCIEFAKYMDPKRNILNLYAIGFFSKLFYCVPTLSSQIRVTEYRLVLSAVGRYTLKDLNFSLLFSMKTGIKTNFLQYNGLIKATKQYLKQFKMKVTNKEMNLFIPSNIQPISRHCKGSKTMYEILNKTN